MVARSELRQSLVLTTNVSQQRAAGDAGTAILLSLEAPRPYAPELELELDGAWRELRERLVLKGHEHSVFSAAFSPDGKRIVTASDDNTARLWDAETGKQIGEPLAGHTDWARAPTRQACERRAGACQTHHTPGVDL
jgi:WD40 repeat protein